MQIGMRFLFLVATLHRRWTDAERRCRIGPTHVAPLFRTFINRGGVKCNPNLCIQTTWLLQSFVCVYPFPVLRVTPAAFETQAHPTFSGTGAMFLELCVKNGIFLSYAMFPEESSQTMRRKEDLLDLWCCFGYRNCRVLNQIHLDLPSMKCEPN